MLRGEKRTGAARRSFVCCDTGAEGSNANDCKRLCLRRQSLKEGGRLSLLTCSLGFRGRRLSVIA
eukprot:15020289-Alexandrium_andersonii.AAC.1